MTRQSYQTDRQLKFIYWFTFYNNQSASVRYRGQYPLQHFKDKYGIDYHLIIPSYRPTKILKFIRAYFSALLFRRTNSLIVIQRLNTNWIYATALQLLIKLRKNDTAYDLDDADYLENPPKSIFYFIKNCSTVFAGSNEIARHLSKYNKNILITTSPTPDLNIVKKKRNSILTIGWIGDFGGGHKESLVTYFFPAIKDLPFKIKLILLGVGQKSEYSFLTDYFKSFDNVSLEMPQNINWTDEQDIQKRVSLFDIGIATLLDNELHRSKSGFKTKQYMNNGVPVLSSDIPENNKVVVHGYNGFLCRTATDFKQRIIEINEMNPDSYTILSGNARQSITNFNLDKYCKDIQTHYRKNGT